MTKHPSNFIWYDLMTTDIAAASAFYADVVGWKITDAGMPGMSYSILKAGAIDVGGMMAAPTDMPASETHPHWNGHIYVSDVDAYSKRAVKAGGRIDREPADIPGIGRFCVIADPHGAKFIMFKPNISEARTKVADGTQGHIGWRELYAGNLNEAWDFYSGLFGWTKGTSMDMGAMGIYQLFQIEGKDAGGMMKKMDSRPVATWGYYFNVSGIDAGAARITKTGGKISIGPHQVPGGRWIVNATDPQGASFSLLSEVK